MSVIIEDKLQFIRHGWQCPFGATARLALSCTGVDLGRPNRRLAVAQFLDSRGQSRLSDVWQSSIFNDKGLGWARQLRPIALSISR